MDVFEALTEYYMTAFAQLTIASAASPKSPEREAMKYKCVNCETEFDVTYDATCPQYWASGYDVEPLNIWLKVQVAAGDES